MPDNSTVERLLEELDASKIWYDTDIMNALATTDDPRALRALMHRAYAYFWNGFRQFEVVETMIQRQPTLETARIVLMVLHAFEDKEPGDGDEVTDLDAYRRWLAEQVVTIGAPSVPLLLEEIEQRPGKSAGYLALALGKLGLGYSSLVGLLTGDWYTVSLAAEALGNMGSREAIPALLQAHDRVHTESTLRYDKEKMAYHDLEVAYNNILIALAKLGEVERAIHVINTDQHLNHRLNAIIALGYSAHGEARNLLEQLVHSPDKNLEVFARGTLKQMNEKRA